MNVTVTAPQAPGFFSLYGDAGTPPGAAELSFSAGQTRAGSSVVPLALDASGFRVLNGSAGASHLIVDVNGYFE